MCQTSTEHPIDLTRYQVINCYNGRAGLINSGGASSGACDLTEAVFTAVVNKRAGGMGLISGRKAFQKPMEEGVKILEDNPEKFMLIADAIVVDNDNNKIYDSANFGFLNGNKMNYFSDKTLKNEILYNWSVVGPVYMLNREIFSSIGFYDPEIYLEDWDYAVRAVSKNLIQFYDAKVAAYRIHDNNTIKNKNAAIMFSESCIKTIEKHESKFSIIDRIRLWNKSRRLKRKINRLRKERIND